MLLEKAIGFVILLNMLLTNNLSIDSFILALLLGENDKVTVGTVS